MNKVLFVDETEDSNYFYVVGLLVESESVVDAAYKSFKKNIKNYPIKKTEKEALFNEFKSIVLDRSYQRIKIKMFEHLNDIDFQIICAYFKKSGSLLQEEKEKQYIRLLRTITNNIDADICIYYDAFHKKDFEDIIETTISKERNVERIEKAESFNVKGLQFVDNVCSSIRRYFDNPKDVYYQLIKSHVIFVK